jgi:hypothetical protein
MNRACFSVRCVIFSQISLFTTFVLRKHSKRCLPPSLLKLCLLNLVSLSKHGIFSPRKLQARDILIRFERGQRRQSLDTGTIFGSCSRIIIDVSRLDYRSRRLLPSVVVVQILPCLCVPCLCACVPSPCVLGWWRNEKRGQT